MLFISPIPSLRPLIRLNILLAVVGVIGCLMPIRLAISLQGVISSDGPTTLISAPNDAVVSSLPKEGQHYTKSAILFRFEQPLLAEKLIASQMEIRDLEQRIKQGQIECSNRIKSAKSRLTDAKNIDNMNTEAFHKQLISQLQLFQYRNAMNTAIRDLDEVTTLCRKEQAELHSAYLSNKSSLRRERISQDFLSTLSAPSDGSIYSIAVKVGQRVRNGDTLARFVRSNQSIAHLWISSADRPFVKVGRIFDVTSPTYSFVATQPVYPCLVETITPDLVERHNNSAVGTSEESIRTSYMIRCRFKSSVDKGPYPLLIGMDIRAKASSNVVTLFQLLLKGYRATLSQTT